MEKMETFVLASAVVTVASSVLKLIDALSGIEVFSIDTNLNGEIRKKE